MQRRIDITAQLVVAFETVTKTDHCLARQLQQLQRLAILLRAGLELVEAVMQRLEQATAPLVIRLQIILQIGVARHYPHIAQHLEQHLRRAPRGTCRAQLFMQAPAILTQVADEDFTIRKGGVVIRNFANAAQVCHGVQSAVRKGWYGAKRNFTGFSCTLSMNFVTPE